MSQHLLFKFSKLRNMFGPDIQETGYPDQAFKKKKYTAKSFSCHVTWRVKLLCIYHRKTNINVLTITLLFMFRTTPPASRGTRGAWRPSWESWRVSSPTPRRTQSGEARRLSARWRWRWTQSELCIRVGIYRIRVQPSRNKVKFWSHPPGKWVNFCRFLNIDEKIEYLCIYSVFLLGSKKVLW